MLAKTTESTLGKIDSYNCKLRIIETVETVAKHDGLGRTAEGMESSARCKWFAVSVIFAPANFEIPKVLVIVAGGPNLCRNIRTFDGNTGVQQTVINDVYGARWLAVSRRKERLVRSGASECVDDQGDKADELCSRPALLKNPCELAKDYNSFAFNLISVPVRALETGQPFFVISACSWKVLSSRPETSASVFSSMVVIFGAPSIISNFTTAVVPMRFGVCPAFVKFDESAIEKQPASAAPISSSGLVPVPFSKRELKE